MVKILKFTISIVFSINNHSADLNVRIIEHLNYKCNVEQVIKLSPVIVTSFILRLMGVKNQPQKSFTIHEDKILARL